MTLTEEGTSTALARRVASNTGIQILAQAVGLVLSLVFLRLATGHLGPAGFGELAIVLAIGGILIPLIDVGMTTTLARELSKSPDRADELGGIVVCTRLATAASFILLTLIALPFLPYAVDVKVALAVYLGVVLFTTLGSFQRAFFQVHLKMLRQAALDILQKLFNIGAVLVAVLFTLDVVGLVAALVVGSAIAAVLSFLLSRPYWRPNMRYSSAAAKPVLRDAFGIGILMLVGLVHFRIDSVLLSLLRPPNDVGVYTIAYRFVENAYYLPGVLVAVMFPILTRYLHHADSRLETTTNRALQFLCVAGLGVALLVFTLAEPIIYLVAGPEFNAAVAPAQILAAVLPILFLTPLFSALLIGVNSQVALIRVGLFALALNITANLIMIPPYGPIGAAWATLGSEGVVLGAVYVLARRTLNLRIELAVIPRAAAATVAGLGIWLVVAPYSDLIAAMLSIGVFTGGAFLFRAVRRADLDALLSRGP